MINAKPDSLGKWNNAKEENSREDNFWQNLTEGELVDIDLFTACALGEYDYVNLIIQNAKSSTDIVNKSNSAGWTPLMYACYVGNDKITELLVREGADVLFDENKRGCTPLMLAAASGNISLVKHLVEVRYSGEQLSITLHIYTIVSQLAFSDCHKAKVKFLVQWLSFYLSCFNQKNWRL